MITTDNSKMINDIKSLLKIGVTKQAIADSMFLSKQGFQYRLDQKRFTIDQVSSFYKKYGNNV